MTSTNDLGQTEILRSKHYFNEYQRRNTYMPFILPSEGHRYLTDVSNGYDIARSVLVVVAKFWSGEAGRHWQWSSLRTPFCQAPTLLLLIQGVFWFASVLLLLLLLLLPLFYPCVFLGLPCNKHWGLVRLSANGWGHRLSVMTIIDPKLAHCHSVILIPSDSRSKIWPQKTSSFEMIRNSYLDSTTAGAASECTALGLTFARCMTGTWMTFSFTATSPACGADSSTTTTS